MILNYSIQRFLNPDYIGEDRFDLAVLDPPYGITSAKWDTPPAWGSLWPRIWSCAKSPQSVVAVFGTGLSIASLIQSNANNYKYSWTWIKNFGTNFFHVKRQPIRRVEQIAIFYRQAGQYFPKITDGHKPTKSCRGKSEGRLTRGANARNTPGGKTTRYPSDVLEFKAVDPRKRVHSSQKPVPLIEYLIETYTKPGDVVFDGFFGSGTTGVACARTGRRFVGCEQDTEIFKKGKERIDEANSIQTIAFGRETPVSKTKN